MNLILSLNSVSKSFPSGTRQVDALSDVTMEVRAGEFIALRGPSGSGKSTLLNIAGLVEQPTSGAIIFDGIEVSSLSDAQRTEYRRTKIGFVFQYFNLLNHLTALENVALTLLLNRYSWTKAEHTAREALATVGLGNRISHRPEQLSGGEMQRVALARAMVHTPALIVADEPTGNLDSHNGELVLTLLKEATQHGAAVLMATHNERAAMLCDRTLTILDGSLRP